MYTPTLPVRVLLAACRLLLEVVRRMDRAIERAEGRPEYPF